MREVKEETGIDIPKKKREPFLIIQYETKTSDSNSLYIANYYFIKADLVPNLKATNFTQEEIDGNLELQFIHKDKAIEILKNSIPTSTRPIVVRDTISVIEAYLEQEELLN